MQVKDKNKNRRSIGVLALVCLVMQLAISPNIAIANGHPNFAFVFAAVCALTIGGRTGVACGFGAGLVYDLTATSPVGLMALLLTCAAYGLGIEVRDRIADNPVTTFIPVSVAALCVFSLYHMAMLLVGLSSSIIDALILRTIPTVVLTVIAYVAFALTLGRRHGSGGPALGSSIGGAHYALPKK